MSAIKLDFDTPVVSNEIKLWDRSVVPLAATSVTHDDYKAHSPAPPTPASRPGYVPNPHKLEGRTTTQDAYQAWAIEQHPAPPPTPPVTSPHRFEGMSVTREDYRPHPPAPPTPASRPGYVPNPHKLEGRTTTQDAYQAISLPVGVQALGVQTQGGGFYPLIPQGSLPPARGAATFTTTRDYQTEVDIKVTAMVDGVAKALGQFALGGIAPTLTGIPQVLVTFELSEQRMLTVSAVDTGSGGEMVLTVRNVS